MKIDRIESNHVLIELDVDELVILNNALNEVCNALNGSEFSTRMGAELEEVRNLLRQIGKTIDAISK